VFKKTTSTRTIRGALSPTRVKLLKESMCSKFKLEGTKKDQNWLLVIQAVNSKGRQLKFNARFRKIIEKIKSVAKKTDPTNDSNYKETSEDDDDDKTTK